jgi:hypothetical protein
VDEADTTYLKGNVKVRTRSQIGINPPGSAVYPSHRYVFKVQVRITNGAGTYYSLERTTAANTAFYDIQAEEMEWTLGANNYFLIYSDTHTEADNLLEKLTQISFTSPFLYTDFDGKPIEMKVMLDHVEKSDGTTLTVPGGNYVGRIDDWNTVTVYMGVEAEGIGSNPDHETLRTCASVTSDNSQTRTIDTYLGDGPAPFSLSAMKVGTAATTGWKINNTGTAKPIAQLLAEQVLRFRKLPQSLFRATFLHRSIRPYERFVDQDKAYMAARIAVSCATNQWEGDFLLFDGDVDGIASTEPFIPPKEPMLPGGPTDQGPPTSPPTVEDEEELTGGDPPPFNGLAGGTVGGYVQMSEQSVTKLRTDLLASDFNTTRLLPVNNVPYSWARKGDRITIINPITNHRETFYVGTSYVPEANTITMSGTDSPMVKDFPFGSLVKLYQPDLVRVKGWSYLQRNVTGSEWTIPNPNTTDPATAGPGGLLPPTTVYDVATLRERVQVWRAGQWLVYDTSTFDNSFRIISGNKIEFYFPLSGEDVMVVVR